MHRPMKLAMQCLIALSIFLILAWPAMAGQSRPNVLLIVCDDLNTHVSTSGYSHISTPAFDELAAAGMTFSRAYCQYPVCGPSWLRCVSIWPGPNRMPCRQDKKFNQAKEQT